MNISNYSKEVQKLIMAVQEEQDTTGRNFQRLLAALKKAATDEGDHGLMGFVYFNYAGAALDNGEHAKVFSYCKKALTEQRDSQKYTKELINLANEFQKEQEIITRRREELIRQAGTDPLTGLPNRYESNIHMDKVFEDAYKGGIAFAAGILDMDGLKAHNDRYGHAA